jgi:hypothetical protein
LGCEVSKRGNPAWVKGKSANPKGRPKGQTSFKAFCNAPSLFLIRHLRWERFCFGLMEPPYTGAAAARKAGYSPKSARFIASRLRKNPIIRAMLREIREITSSGKAYRDWLTGKCIGLGIFQRK